MPCCDWWGAVEGREGFQLCPAGQYSEQLDETAHFLWTEKPLVSLSAKRSAGSQRKNSLKKAENLLNIDGIGNRKRSTPVVYHSPHGSDVPVFFAERKADSEMRPPPGGRKRGNEETE